MRGGRGRHICQLLHSEHVQADMSVRPSACFVYEPTERISVEFDRRCLNYK
jgi:hypothetical protein